VRGVVVLVLLLAVSFVYGREDQNESRDEGFASLDLSGANFGSNLDDGKLKMFPTGWLRKNKHKLQPYEFSFLGTSDEAVFVALYGEMSAATKKYPQSVTIPVRRTADQLVFLHTELGDRNPGELVWTYRVRFTDGGSVDVPVREGMEVSGRYKPRQATNARHVVSVFNGSMTNKVYLFRWAVPKKHAGKEIKDIELLSAQTKSVPVILGIGSLAKGGTRSKTAVGKKKTATVTVHFKKTFGTICPYLFGTNDGEWTQKGDNERYHQRMAAMGLRMIRLHFHRKLNRLFPKPDPNTPISIDDALYDKTFLRPDRQGQKIMLCFGRPPKWVDMSDAEHREIYAEQCTRLARHLLDRGYAITYWQPFNEPYGGGIAKDRGMWHFYNRLAEKLKAVDPEAKIGGPVYCWPDEGMIEDFLKHCAGNVDFVAWHCYPTGSTKTPTDVLMRRTKEFGEKSRAVRRLTKKYIPDRYVPMALTEYNMNYEWRPRKDPRQITNVGACWTASVLKHLIDARHDIALTWHSRDKGFGLLSDDDEPRPTAALLTLFNQYYADAKRAWSKSDNEDVEVVASRGKFHCAAMIINTSSEVRNVTFILRDLPRASLPAYEQAVKEFRISETDSPVTSASSTIPSDDVVKQIFSLSPYSLRLFVYPMEKTP
jgi:xylan 1,4-beta-xylosidase